MKPICAADETHLRRRWDPSAPQMGPICAADRPICAADRPICAAHSPHLRRTFAPSAPQIATSAPLPCAICGASMCDLHGVHDARRALQRRAPAAALPRGCGGRQRPLAVHPRTRRANPGILKWWQVRRLASCRTPRHGGYSTPSLVTRRRRRVTSFAFPSGGAPTGASANSTYNAPSGPGSPARCVCAAAGCLLRALPLPAARAAATRRTLAGCVCAAGCRTPHARPGSSVRCVCAASCYSLLRAPLTATAARAAAAGPHTLLAACLPQAAAGCRPLNARLTPA